MLKGVYDGPNVRICRACGSEETTICDTRVHATKDILIRRRRCLRCRFRWATVEINREDYEALTERGTDDADIT